MKLMTYLFIINHNIRQQMPNSVHLVNNEEEFKLKHVLPFLQLILHDKVIRCDVASKAYEHIDTNLFAIIRPDFIIMNEETELATIEVKPFNSSCSSIEADEVRVAELSKKILHRRMMKAKTEKESVSFGVTIVGDVVNLYKHEFKNKKYIYKGLCTLNLPIMDHTSTHMSLALESFLAFKNLIKATLPSKEDFLKPYMANTSRDMKPTALYF